MTSPTPGTDRPPDQGWLVRFDELLGRPISTRSMAALRIAVGPIAILHLQPILAAALDGDTFHDRYHRPYWSWLPVPGPGAFTGLLLLGVLAAAAMTIGLATRVATTTTFAVIAYHLALSTTHVHNNRAYLVTVVFLLSLAPCGRVWSVDAWLRRRRGVDLDDATPAWPLWLLRLVCATVYGASGLSKLLDPDWFGGDVTWGRVANQEADLRASVLPDVVVDVLLDRSFHTVAAKAIVLTELFIALGLWWRRTRPFAVATAVAFHVLIEASAAVQVFSYLGIAVLLVWADPALPHLRRGALRHLGTSALSKVSPWRRPAADSSASWP